MNVEDYRMKTQRISNLLSLSTCPEDILNCRDIDLKNDFQYLCFSCSSNIDLVDDVIARLAENGNKDIVEQNINHITINMWKDLFNKNDVTKELFIKNYNNITGNAGIITYREIEGFIDDEQTRPLVYGNLELIIKKLCTYDRASLIKKLKVKQGGIDKIKENIEVFFQKGEFDISTTYSKILMELNDVPGISKIEILEACSKHLIDMLERETAIDNETNDLLDWIYDSMEETKMYDEQRKYLQNDIDNAILDNFDSILDKSNYDRVTMKILKQFPCTYSKFENNKNLYIDKSNEKLEMTKSIGEDYKTECTGKFMEDNTTIHSSVVSSDSSITDKCSDTSVTDESIINENNNIVINSGDKENISGNDMNDDSCNCRVNEGDVEMANGNHAVDIEEDKKNNMEDIEIVDDNHAVDIENNKENNAEDIEIVNDNHTVDIENNKENNAENIEIVNGNHAFDIENNIKSNVEDIEIVNDNHTVDIENNKESNVEDIEIANGNHAFDFENYIKSNAEDIEIVNGNHAFDVEEDKKNNVEDIKIASGNHAFDVEEDKKNNPEDIEVANGNHAMTIENEKKTSAEDVGYAKGNHAVSIEDDKKSDAGDVRMVVGSHSINNGESNSITCAENVCQIEGNHAIHAEDKFKNDSEGIESFEGSHAVSCEENLTIDSNGIDISANHIVDDKYNHVDEKNETTCESWYEEAEQSRSMYENENQSQTIHGVVDYNVEKIENEFEDLNVLAKFSELMEKNNENDSSGAGNYISSLIKNNIQETDRIIARILRKDTVYTTQNEVGNNTQGETQNEIQEKTEKVIQVEAQNGVQDETQNSIENEMQDETQNMVNNEIQDETKNVVKNEIQNETQNMVNNEIQNETQNMVNNEMQDEAQNVVKNEMQDETQNVVKNEMQDETQNVIKNEMQDETQNAIKNEMQDETQNVIENEVQVEEQNGMLDGRELSEVRSVNTFGKETTKGVVQVAKGEQAEDIVINESIEKDNEKQALVVKEEAVNLQNENSIFRKIWKKIKTLFAKLKTYKIGE